jgi:outer membrane protein, heavy metal efflux system
MSRSIILVTALLAFVPGMVAAQETDLTLREVYELALERSRSLQAARASAAGVSARESSAGLPPDPQVQLGAMNLSLPDLSADMPAAMAPSIQVMQMIPIAGKLGLRGAIARQGTAMAQRAADEVWWEVRTRAALLYYDVYQSDRQVAVMEETLDWLVQFEQIARTMYTVGSGTQSDVLRAGVAVARLEADIVRMRAMRTSAAAQLNALLDRPAAFAIGEVVLAALPDSLPTQEVLSALAEDSRPMLARGRTGVQQARTRGTLARREIWPDLTVGVQYGQRRSDMGTERMGSLMLGFSVPVFAGRRQLQMRTEASAMQQMAEAELDDMRAQVNARIAGLLADLDRARTLVTLYRTEVLPQADANVTSALSSYRVGRVDFMTMLDAQMTTNEYRQELYALLAEYGAMIAELEMTIGRELPVTTTPIVEEE